jgi:hypothetical protein
MSARAAANIQHPLPSNGLEQPHQDLIFKISDKPVLRVFIPIVVLPGSPEIENISHDSYIVLS